MTSTSAPTTTAGPTDDPYEDMNVSKLGKVRGRASVIVLFSVGADGGQAGHALDFAKATLDEWSKSPSSVPMSVYDSINKALEAAGIYVTIVGVAFTAPTMGSKVVDHEMPEVEQPPDYIYWLTIIAAVAVGLLFCLGLRYLIKKRLKARRKKKLAQQRYLLPTTGYGQPGQLTVEQEKQLMMQYGYRPPLQGATISTQTEPWAYPVQNPSITAVGAGHGGPGLVAPSLQPGMAQGGMAQGGMGPGMAPGGMAPGMAAPGMAPGPSFAPGAGNRASVGVASGIQGGPGPGAGPGPSAGPAP